MDSNENCPYLPARDLFTRLGYEPLPPSEVDDAQLTGRLWEFIYALAGRRFYLYRTDHLSDRQIYTWLHDRWLAAEVPDLPFESGWNSTISPGQEEGADIYLRFYASEEERESWLADFPEDTLPPSEQPSYDRDRWLPDPPLQSCAEFEADEMAMEEEEEAAMLESGGDAYLEKMTPEDIDCDDDDDEGDIEDSSMDPLGLAAVDREIRAQKDPIDDEDSDVDDEGEDDALDDPAFDENWERPRDVLRREGVRMLPPDELTDESVPGHLWELLHNLACRGFYVQHTDHLSDRELYAEIWEHGLTDLSLLPGKCQTGGWFHDVIGSGGREDEDIYLSYYATDQERHKHAAEFPEEPLPPRKSLVSHRDWRLPKGPF